MPNAVDSIRGPLILSLLLLHINQQLHLQKNRNKIDFITDQVFSRKIDSTIANVCLSVCLSVCPSVTETPQPLRIAPIDH